MSQFRGVLSITPFGKKLVRINQSFSFDSQVLGMRVTIPIGFMSDGASVPKFLWLLIPPWDDWYGMAAVIHDYLYRWQRYPREQCDGVLLEAMNASKPNWWKMVLIYCGVRLFGGPFWKRDGLHPLSQEERAPNEPNPWLDVTDV